MLITNLYRWLIHFNITDDNIDETYGVNVQFESDEEVSYFRKFLRV